MSFIREAHDWKVDVFSSVFEALHSVKVRRGLEDKMWWVSSKKKVCSRSSPSFRGSRFPWKSVWRTQALSRAAFLV